jgi:hypothetical protein
VASASATAAVASASATTTTAVASASAATATTAAFALRAGFIDHQSAAEKFLAVQRGDGFFGFGVVFNFCETEAAGLAGETIAKQSKRIGLNARFGKKPLHILFCSLER